MGATAFKSCGGRRPKLGVRGGEPASQDGCGQQLLLEELEQRGLDGRLGQEGPVRVHSITAPAMPRAPVTVVLAEATAMHRPRGQPSSGGWTAGFPVPPTTPLVRLT